MVELSFTTISKKLKDFKIPHFDLVVGIAKGGIVPACLLAYKAGCDLRLLNINYRDEDNRPKYSSPMILGNTDIPKGVRKIMAVDDISVSGKTLLSAKTLLRKYRVKSFVLVGKADYVLFPKISECVKWPWKIDFEKVGDKTKHLTIKPFDTEQSRSAQGKQCNNEAMKQFYVLLFLNQII